jgi:uncharacterized protein GlcG (DUF336 family)
MTIKFNASALALASLLAVGASQAQQTPAAPPAPAANPMDTVPEKMPFDIPYGVPITLDRAEAVLAASLGESKNRNWKLICSVVDSGGNLVSFKRMDNAQIASIDIAIHKARTAVKFRRETKVFEENIQKGFNYLITLDDVIGSRGGIPLIEGGKIIGAVGCSGGTGSQDEVVAKAGAALVK